MTTRRHHVPFSSLLTGFITLGLLSMFAGSVQPPGMPPASRPETRPESPLEVPDATDLPTREGLFVRSIEHAHGAKAWRSRTAIQFDLHIVFGGADYLQCHMIFELETGRARIELDDETVLVFDGTKAWVSPSTSEFKAARFNLLTWPYFLAAPFKLNDPGTRLELGDFRTLNLRMCSSARLTFEAGTGDTPDDWYVVYADPTSNRLAGLAYIVTYGTSVEDASKEPHALVYQNYRTLEGVTLSTKWVLYQWDETLGTKGEPLGQAFLENLQFVTPEEDAFEKPANAREDALPES